MGFYGNITNVARTQFQFDRTYSSRYIMDLSCGSDGVYPGRYVLVEYGSQEVQIKRVYMNDGVPYAGINSHPYYDGTTKEIIQTYIQPPDEKLRYKIVTRNYQNKENDLIIYEDEIIAIPPGRRIITNNSENKYFTFSDFNKADSIEVSLEDYEKSQEILKSYLEEKNLITSETPWETWSECTHVHIVNGKVVFGSLQIVDGFNDYPVSKNSIVWKVNPGDDYRTNEYTTYFKPDLSQSELENNVFSNVSFMVVSGTGGDDYSNNHALDKEYYNTSRGYDSTVWQKVLSGGVEKYVMVAELNSVVPTFSIVNDAPSLIPLAPHFDGNSTNVYYRLHWQPSWAIRTKAAFPHYKVQSISQQGTFSDTGHILASSDTAVYPSDQFTTWKGKFYNTISNSVYEKSYNREKNKWEEETELDKAKGNYDIPAAIYFNKDGFNPSYVSHSTLLTLNDNNPNYNGAVANSNPEWSPTEDKIGFFPTGRSGHMYNDHNDSLEGSPQVDTQEFMIMLPSIGNAIASVWDMVYGGRETNITIRESLQRNMSIGWCDGADLPNRTGLRLRSYDDGYNTAEVNTIAGAINSVHDLMGMIITKSDIDLRDTTQLNPTTLSMDRIYYNIDDKDYYRKQLQYEYKEITSAEEYKAAQDNAYTSIPFTGEGSLKDFNSSILTSTNSEGKLVYNPVFYQEANNSVKGNDATKYNYIQEISYHPDRLYFALDGLQIYDGDEENLEKLKVYTPDSYFYTTGSKDALILDEEEEASVAKTYYEIKNVKEWGNREQFYNYEEVSKVYTKIISIPSKYDLDENYNPKENSREAEKIHGIYQPNKYYFAEYNDEGKIVKFILDTNPDPSDIVHFTINKSEEISPEEGSYRLETKYSLVNESEVNINTEDNYQPYVYYYIPATTSPIPSKTQILNGDVSEDIFQLATVDWKDLPNIAHHFGDNIYVFRKVKEYVQISEPSYKIEPKPIFLYPWEPQSIFQAIFDEVTGKLAKIVFFNQDNIPVTEWEKIISDSGEETLELVLKDKNDKILSDIYVLGIHPGDQFASGYSLISLSEIENKTVNNHYISKCEGTFYESGLYHYLSKLETFPRDQSYLLDNSLSGQYADKEYITYYKINEENISLIPGTFKATEIGSYPTIKDYQGKNYYYKAGDGKYKPVIKTPAKNTKLYTVVPSNDFYEPNKYYITNSEQTGEYVLSRSDEMPTGVTLYKKNGIYVIEDKNGVYPYGTEWNLNATSVPEGVTVATRTEKYGVTKIPNLARTDNTIHGLILRINQILEAGNTGIRDVSTVQGALNRLNDIIARIDKMQSGQFMIVDEYGRMHSADYSTAQAFSTTNEQKTRGAETNAIALTEDRWISLEVSPKYNEPKFTVQHNFTKVDDTKTKANKNGAQTLETDEKDGNNHNTNDTLELYTPIVDNTGHIVGKNTETVTLPYGFKSISLDQAEDTDRGQLSTNAATVTANNTKDELTLAAANKWIRTAGTDSNNTIQIAHEIHTPTKTEKTATDLNNGANTITLQDITYDEAGHITGDQPHTYTLPYGFKTITAANSDATSTGANTINNNNVIADNTQDTLALQASNKWIKLDTNTVDTVKFGHYAGGFTKGAANTEYGLSASKTITDLDNGNSFIVPNFKFDEAGHIISAENQTISLPENFTKIATTVETGTANSTAGAAGTIEADTLTDTLTLAEGNKWINIIADATNDKITFSHYVSAFSDSAGTAVNFNNTGNAFTVVSHTTHDEAGHLTGVTNTTFTLPNSLKTINIGAGNDSVNFATASNTAIVADSPRASMSINPGNRWITLTSDGSIMTINHAAAGAADSTKADGINTSQAPVFGGTFNIPTFGIDQAGHISTVGTKTVVLPSLPVLANSVLGGETAINALNSQIINGVATNAVTFDKDSSTLISIINSLITRINELEATIAILHP